jgi:tetratricopeptide (TPR) repeat protein
MAACSGPPARSIERVAFLPWDNLTGDSSLDWMAAAGPKIALAQLTGAAHAVPLQTPGMRDALGAAATRYVHGFFDRRGPSVHFEISVEDAATHKMTNTLALDGNLLDAMNKLAMSIDPSAHPFSTANPGAVEAWGKGDYQRAVTLDPDFGAAWVAWAQALAAGNPGAPQAEPSTARETAERGLARTSLRTPVDRAQLQLLDATFSGDTDARRAALSELSRMVPADTSVTALAAESEMLARNFTGAAKLYSDSLHVDPNNAAMINALGYAYGLAGDLANARKTFADYARFQGQEANAFDSMGEVLFVSGQFAEAEKQFLDAHGKNAGMLAGGDLSKAAYARWLGGDLPGADQLFKRYLEFRTKAGDPTVAWREANWLYATGRTQQAVAKLTNPEGRLSPQVADLAAKQLAVWKNPMLPHDVAPLRQAYEHTPPAADGLLRTAYAAALWDAGNRAEAGKLLQHWPLPEQAGDPYLQSLLYPKFRELKGKLQEAGDKSKPKN